MEVQREASSNIPERAQSLIHFLLLQINLPTFLHLLPWLSAILEAIITV